MSANIILRGAEWVLTSERPQAAPDALYVVQCLICRAESGLVDNDPKRAGVWAMEHARRTGREHCQFRVTSQKHWRVDPVPPAVVPTPMPTPRPRAHVRRRGRRLPGLVGLAALVTGAAMCGYLLAAVSGT
jgi:hypothetical protein